MLGPLQVDLAYDQSPSPALQSYDQMSLTPMSFPQTYDQPLLLPPTTHTPSPVGAASGMNVGAAVMSSPTDSSPAPVVPRGPYLAVGKSNTRYLPSSAIRKDQLRNIDELIAQHRNLVHKDTAGTLCQILAREAVFGRDILAQCTITGHGGKTALPLQELR